MVAESVRGKAGGPVGVGSGGQWLRIGQWVYVNSKRDQLREQATSRQRRSGARVVHLIPLQFCVHRNQPGPAGPRDGIIQDGANKGHEVVERRCKLGKRWQHGNIALVHVRW